MIFLAKVGWLMTHSLKPHTFWAQNVHSMEWKLSSWTGDFLHSKPLQLLQPCAFAVPGLAGMTSWWFTHHLLITWLHHLLMDLHLSKFLQKLHQQRSLTSINIRRGFWEFRVNRIPSPDFQWDAIRQPGVLFRLSGSFTTLSLSLFGLEGGFTAACWGMKCS